MWEIYSARVSLVPIITKQIPSGKRQVTEALRSMALSLKNRELRLRRGELVSPLGAVFYLSDCTLKTW